MDSNPFINPEEVMGMFERGLSKIPPHVIEAEIAILRIMFHNNESIKVVKQKLSKSGQEFYRYKHQVIYKTMLKFFNEERPIDLITLLDEFRNEASLETIGGISYLKTLFLEKPPTIQNDGYSPDNLDQYIKIVKEKYLIRRLIVLIEQVLDTAYRGNLKSLKGPIRKLIVEGNKVLKEMRELEA